MVDHGSFSQGAKIPTECEAAISAALTTEAKVAGILSGYLALINSTPALLSLLYDTDLLPEQIVSVRGAISVAAVCEAYKAGKADAAARSTAPLGMSEANEPKGPDQ